MRITNLSSAAVTALSKVLQIREKEDVIEYGNRILTSIKALPSDLRKDSRLSQMFKSKPRTELCRLHHNLNANLAYSIFSLFSLEVGHHLNNLHVNIKILPQQHQERILRLREVHQLWLSSEKYCHTFQTQPSKSWVHQHDQCEACIVARMTKELGFLLDLLIIARSRMHHNHQAPTITSFLEAFIENHRLYLPEGHLSTALADAESQSLDLRSWRKKLRQEQKRQGIRRGLPVKQVMQTIREDEKVAGQGLSSSTLVPSPQPADPDQDPHDTVLSIIDHYAYLRSSPHLPLEEMEAFNRANAFHPRPDSEFGPPVPDRNTGYEPEAPHLKADVYDARDNGHSSVARKQPHQPRKSAPTKESQAEPAGYVPPRANWRSSDKKQREKSKKPEPEHLTYGDFQRWKRGEIRDPFARADTRSRRNSRTTIDDRKEAYKNLVANSPQISIPNSERLTRPKGMEVYQSNAYQTNASQWTEMSLPPSPTESVRPTAVKPQASSIYSTVSPLPSPTHPSALSPAETSPELGFEKHFRQHPPRPEVQTAASSFYSTYAPSTPGKKPSRSRHRKDRADSVRPPVPRVPSVHARQSRSVKEKTSAHRKQSRADSRRRSKSGTPREGGGKENVLE